MMYSPTIALELHGEGINQLKAAAIDAAIVANFDAAGFPEVYTLGPDGVIRCTQ